MLDAPLSDAQQASPVVAGDGGGVGWGWQMMRGGGGMAREYVRVCVRHVSNAHHPPPPLPPLAAFLALLQEEVASAM